MLTDKIERRPVFAGQQGEPAPSLLLRADLHPSDEITFRENANQLSAGVDDGQTADAVGQHGPDRLDNRCVGANRDDMP
jgi:hypothetical protein